MQLTIIIKDGATNVEIANQLRWQANLIEGIEPKAASAVKNTKAAAATAPIADDDDEDFAPKAEGKKSKAAASFDDEAEEAETDDDDADFTTPAPKAEKKTKAKKLTIDDVNDACKARAAKTGGKAGRQEVLALLKKKFKTESVSDLKVEQYADAITAMA